MGSSTLALNLTNGWSAVSDQYALDNGTLPALPKRERRDFAKLVKVQPVYIEAELTFLVSNARAEKEISNTPHTSAIIHRSYFAPKDLEWITEHAIKAAGLKKQYPRLPEITSARVGRTISADGSEDFELTLKGRKHAVGTSRLARLEINIPLDEGEYTELRSDAAHGYIKKERFRIQREVIMYTGRQAIRGIIFPEIDFPKFAGQGLKEDKISSRKDKEVSFAMIDIDVAATRAPVAQKNVFAFMHSLRGGNHSMSALKNHGIELSHSERGAKVEYLSARALAHAGLGRAEAEARQLLKLR